MGQKWIIDVLAALEAFARDNDLPKLADCLVESARVARSEVRAATYEVVNGTTRARRDIEGGLREA